MRRLPRRPSSRRPLLVLAALLDWPWLPNSCSTLFFVSRPYAFVHNLGTPPIQPNRRHDDDHGMIQHSQCDARRFCPSTQMTMKPASSSQDASSTTNSSCNDMARFRPRNWPSFAAKAMIAVSLIVNVAFPSPQAMITTTPDSPAFTPVVVSIHPTAAYAATAMTSATTTPKTGMACVTSYCRSELTQCIQNPTCAKGLGCFVSCATSTTTSPLNSKDHNEGACQVRCTDLYENPQLNAFTECTLTQHGCYPALPADERYPPLPNELSVISSSPSQLSRLLRGRWYISAGLNDMFDTFDCQAHDFFEPSVGHTSTDIDAPVRPSTTNLKTITPNEGIVLVADASFSYRIALDRNHYMTRVGQKRLYLKPGDAGMSHMHSDNMPTEIGSSINPALQFQPGKKWGRDTFVRKGNSPSRSSSRRHKGDPYPQLALTTVPNYMAYEDDWVILSASMPQNNDNDDTVNDNYSYMVVAYRGVNAAWQGYGGLNVYTRIPINLKLLLTSPTLSARQEHMLRGIQQGLDKVGLTMRDLIHVDNSCVSQ